MSELESWIEDDLNEMEDYCKQDVLITEELMGVLTPPPPPAGFYVLGDLRFTSHKKPCWIHRTMIRLLLGIDWEDS